MMQFFTLWRIAVRNLFGSFLNFMIGMIMLVGTMLFVVGGSLLNSMDSAMSKSITGSVAGHIQVYSDSSKDDLALFDNWGSPDITPIADFSKIRPHLTGIKNIKSVIPMGVNGASVTYGNTVDLTLEKLRKDEKQWQAGTHSAELKEQIASLKSHVRQIITVIQGDYKNLNQLASKEGIDQDVVKALEKASSSEFWNTFDSDPFNHLEFMENKIASLIPDADMIYFSYVGTDLDAFQKSFDRMEIVDGQMVPSGRRGVMLAKFEYEALFKLKTAHRLDKIKEALQDEGKKIATDPDLQMMIKQNKTQTREIILQLDPLSAGKVTTQLQGFLSEKETDLAKLLASLFTTNDENFLARYQFFYKEIAPYLELYRLRPGDTLTIKAFTKSGFIQSANVKVWGTFQFKGLEKSGMAGGLSLMDMMTFRDLYGYVTPEKLKESKKLQAQSGVKFVEKSNAEAELFGGASVTDRAKEARIDENAELGGIKYNPDDNSKDSQTFTSEDIENGVVLNAAIILHDPDQLQQTIQEIQAISKKENLNLRAVTWQKAAGFVGQFVFFAKLALYFAVAIIFVVALVIINNAVMMATLQRTREIGTMRAIGAQRSFVLGLVLVETLLLGIVFGTIGVGLGSMIVKLLGMKGIPAVNEFLYFFFSGPRLYATLSTGSLVSAIIIIVFVTSFSALYPAIIATRVSPLQAMQTEE